MYSIVFAFVVSTLALIITAPSLSLKFVANAGSIAEEVLSAIRTTQAFGSQHVLAELFNGDIAQSRVVDTKAAAWLAGSVSVFFFVLYGSYGLCEWHASRYSRLSAY